MTTEEKARAWDHAVNAFGYLLDKTDLIKGELKENVERIFPELAESEDEKIRKEIITYFKLKEEAAQKAEYFQSERGFSRWIAWLEKQGEQKPVEWSEEDTTMLNDCVCAIQAADEVDYSIEDKAELIGWLKSLRPQKQWKPSEYEIQLLKDVASGVKDPVAYGASMGLIIGGLEQLKAL